jgi:hypothetical protein
LQSGHGQLSGGGIWNLLRPITAISGYHQPGEVISDRPLTINGVDYFSHVVACIENLTESAPWECGVRDNIDEVYFWDGFFVKTKGEEAALGCLRVLDEKQNSILAASCGKPFLQGDPGQEFRVKLNDLGDSVVTIPDITVLTSPEQDSEVSISAGEDLRITWEPTDNGDWIEWSVNQQTDSEGERICKDRSWRFLEGYPETDTGELVIPNSDLPKDLPPEGCPSELVLTRARSGTKAPDIKNGFISGRLEHHVRIVLKP